MTAPSYGRQVESPALPEQPARADATRRVYLLTAVALAGCEVAGIAAIVRGYQVAATTLTSEPEFAWFWFGMALLLLPIAVIVMRRATSPALRTALLTFYGLVSYAPKLLRNPTGPLYHDEFAHWRATDDILRTGKLFRPGAIVPIISQYPGLHAVTAAVVHATGLSIWQAAVILLTLFHVTLILGIATLAQMSGMDSRTASLTAILYSLNSSFLYFDTQFGYESMAITLMVWALAAYAGAIRSRSGPERAAWIMVTVLLSAGTVVTHHLSAFTLVIIMLLAAAALSVPALARRDGWRRTVVTAWGLSLAAAGLTLAWFFFVAPTTLSYLSPYLSGGFSQLVQLVRGAGGSRHLFGASLSPWWEQKAAFLVPVLALALFAAGLLLVRSRMRNGLLPRGRRRALLLAFAGLGLVYFPSVLFILSAQGAEGARRSWAFSWVGLTVLAGPAAVWLVDWAGRRPRSSQRIAVRAGLAATLAVVLVGGTAAGLDASYRFPGPFLYGSDARSVTPELLAASTWFSDRFGTGNNIVTDRYTGLVFASFGLQDPANPSAGFPVYDLYLAKPGAPVKPAYLLAELSSSHYNYLIVDQRMAYELPQIGVYFEPDEPPSQFLPHDGKPVFYQRLNKFNALPWMVKVYRSDNFSIYRLNLPSTTSYQQRPPTARGRLSVTP